MMDLHLHTYYSDGSISPEELVLRAKANGVTKIAITDHDGTRGIKEGLEAGARHGIEVIPGVELSAGTEEGEIIPGERAAYAHILGYEIDPANEPLQAAIRDILQKRHERNVKILAALGEIGYPLTMEDCQMRPQQDYIGKPLMARALVKKGYISSPSEAFEPGKFLEHPDVKSNRRPKIPMKEAISLIRGAGGFAVLAHPLKTKWLGKEEYDENGEDIRFKRLEILLDQLCEWGLEGMECHYSTHTPEEIEKLVAIAQRRGLKITAGSDFHGPEFKSWLDIGVTVKPESQR